MGYYINPLITVLLGMIVLKEKLNIWQYLAIGLAAIGVIMMTVQYGKLPWIALILACTFAGYSLVKKIITIDSINGLALETIVIMPLALIYLVFKQIQGTSALGNISVLTMVLLFCSGIATATPLLWFAKGAPKTELSTIGFLQYIAPTISLGLGVFVFQEQFTKVHLLSFSFIWVAIFVYSLAKSNLFKNKGGY